MNGALQALLREPRLAELLEVLNGDGEEARIVGGAVRNGLLGMPVNDVDIATTALPDVAIARGAAAGFHVVPTGLKHGTVTMIVRGQPFEVTTLREDIETNGRHALVRFGRDFEADALRRDFTINALFLSRNGQVHDYCGGLADIAARRVRFIGDPHQRIREDYLRILRLFRFHAAYGHGAVDGAGFDAAIALREGLSQLSRERIRAEVLKLLAAPGAVPVIEQMDGAGFLLAITGGVAAPARLSGLADAETKAGLAPDAVLRLGALAVRTVEDAERLRERLRLSNDEASRLDILARQMAVWHGRPAPDHAGAGAAAALLLFEAGRRAAQDTALMGAADATANAKRPWLRFLEVLRATPEPVLPVKGEDLLRRGLSSGKIIGQTLKRFQALWIRAGFPQEPGALARLIDEAILQTRREMP